MADNKIHIIITGETGTGRTLLVAKKKFYIFTSLFVIFLCIGTVSGLRQLKNGFVLQKQAIASSFPTLKDKYTSEVNHLKKALTETKIKLAELKLEKLEIRAQYESQISELKQNQTELLENSISRLDQRSKIIKTMMDQIGVKIDIEEDPEHSGGLYIDAGPRLPDQLILKTDRYLEVIRQLPLGRPVKTKISSKYGRRSDPMNHKKAFHSGIDFKGRTGDKVFATADGVVKTSSSDKGLGKFIVITHGNGYRTLYAHLSERRVKRGDKITRGQIIGLVGNTGRSTGSHLHYEVHYRNKTIDPLKFMQVSKLLSAN